MADITKLKQAGIHTVSGAQMTTRRHLAKIKGFSEAKIEKIKEACAKLLVRQICLALIHVLVTLTLSAICDFPECRGDLTLPQKGVCHIHGKQGIRCHARWWHHDHVPHGSLW